MASSAHRFWLVARGGTDIADCHYVLYALFRRLSLRRHSIVAEEIITHTQQVSRLMFLLLAVSMVIPKFDVPD
jgi:hypothetical protein